MSSFRILALCVLIVSLLTTACCGGSSSADEIAIEDTIRGYITTYNAGNLAQCLTYFTDYEDETEALASLSFMRGFLGEITLQSIDDLAISGETATATVTILIWGEPDTDQMHLRKENGVWKIVWWVQEPQSPSPIPPEVCLPGTGELAPELQGRVRVEHCLWLEEDGVLYGCYQVWHIGGEVVCPFLIVYAYDAAGQEIFLESWGGIVGQGGCIGCCDIHSGMEYGLHTTVTHYKIIVESSPPEYCIW